MTLKDTLREEREEFETRIDYNAHDMGELGRFIRTEYAKNIFADYHTRILNALLEEIEGMEKKREGKDISENLWYMDGYDDALTDLAEIIKSALEK